ncbi:MAG: hypothetical protein HY963_07555 [Ignavibacteriales bacterium]|nr:hypothetical protein [Ignavibacteriales bacterium]
MKIISKKYIAIIFILSTLFVSHTLAQHQHDGDSTKAEMKKMGCCKNMSSSDQEMKSEIKGTNKQKIFFSIADTGIGISEDFFPKLFLPFTQEDHGYTRKFEGNGLGLELVKGFCEINKTEIKVVSSKGKGTTFTIKFNLV